MMASSRPSPVSRYSFDGLPLYKREEAALWNQFCRVFADPERWQRWVQEGLADLLQAPSGIEISLSQRNSVHAGRDEREYAFAQDEIVIGRDTGADINLPTQSAGKRHARIFLQNGTYYIEDLGIPLGTYLNDNKLVPNRPVPLQNGSRFAIFPFVFTAGLRQLWVRESAVAVHGGSVQPTTWRSFCEVTPPDWLSFRIEVHPAGAAACLEVNRQFLNQLLERVLLPAGLDAASAGWLAPDSAIVEFLIASLLERVNRDLNFPYQFEPGICGSAPECAPGTRGMSLSFSAGAGKLKGAFRVFLPFAVMARLQPEPAAQMCQLPGVSWRFPIACGYADLTPGDLSLLEPQDVLLLDRECAVLFPGVPERGWRASLLPAGSGQDSSEGRNYERIRIDNYFERELLKSDESPPQSEQKAGPDLSRLPLRVHVILDEKELTMAEAAGLVNGAVLELEREKSDPVLLSVNGKVLGQGELVDIEGRLGVRILSWKGA